MDFVQQYFCDPILKYSGYNLINTAVYAAILLIVSFVLVLPWLRKNRIMEHPWFLFSVIPFIVLGSSLRILEDLRIFPRSCNPLEPAFYTISPGIYILIGILTIVALWLSLRAGKEHGKALKIFAGIGTLLSVPVLVFLLPRFQVWDGFFGVFAFAAILTFIAWLATRSFVQTRIVLQNRLNQTVFFGQMLDASATFTAIEFYNCTEQHVLSAGIIDSFGPIAFVIVKFALMLAVLYYTDKEIEKAENRVFIKLLIAIIGFAPGLRDVLTLAVGTCL